MLISKLRSRILSFACDRPRGSKTAAKKGSPFSGLNSCSVPGKQYRNENGFRAMLFLTCAWTSHISFDEVTLMSETITAVYPMRTVLVADNLSYPKETLHACACKVALSRSPFDETSRRGYDSATASIRGIRSDSLKP